VVRLPWEYLFLGFNSRNFHDLFHPLWVASLVLLVALVALYAIRTRQLRGHRPYLDLYEWLLWSGGITFFLILVYAVFAIDFLFVLATLVVGLGAMAYARFRRYPPLLAAYQQRLARERYFSSRKFGHPEATIRRRRRRRR
jgi:hypothetical protein